MKALNKKTTTMRKSIIYIAIALLAGPMVMAQEFNVGTNVVNGGIGFGGSYGNYTTSSQSPGFSISYERGIWDVPGPGVVSLGGYVGTKTYKYNYLGGNDKWSYTIIGVRGAYHYTGLNVDNLDVYGGLMATYNFLSYSGAGSYGGGLSATAFAGGRWYFSKNLAVFAELGYGVAYLTVGASIRI
jgi:hypothetical protein